MTQAAPSVTRPLRVLMVSTSYPRSDTDWAGRFIHDMVGALTRRSDLELQLWAPPTEAAIEAAQATTPSDRRWLAQLLSSGGIAQQLKRGAMRGGSAAAQLLLRLAMAYRRHRDVDLVHANWLHTALPLWGSSTPLLTTVLGTDYALLRHRPLTALLQSTLAQRPCVVAPNASWMTPKLGACFPTSKVCAVPFGVEPRWYAIERKVPSIGAPRKWLVVLRVTRAKIGPLFDWGRAIAEAGDELHLLGPMQEELELPDFVHYHGATNPDALATKWFPEAAGLITLSQHDEGRPQVILEAMAAGLPVIASGQVAHADVIQDGSTGWLVNTQDQFNRACEHLRQPSNNAAMGAAAQSRMRTTIGTWDDCAERYVSLYRGLLEKAVT